MSLIDNIKSGISRAIWKGVKHSGTAVVGLAAAFALKKFNFQLAEDHQVTLAIAISGALGAGLKLDKDKLPKQLGWL